MQCSMVRLSCGSWIVTARVRGRVTHVSGASPTGVLELLARVSGVEFHDLRVFNYC